MTKKSINTEDSELFRQTIGEIRPLHSEKVPFNQKDKPKPYPKRKTVDVEARLTNTAPTDVEKLGHEDSLSFVTDGLQKNIFKKLRQGYFGLDAELDLHGLTSHQAKQQLLHFLHDCVVQGYRCVHIVHGKGYRSNEDYPILKNNINVWLRQHQDVQAFCSAPQKEGGAGAVFVLLYANRSSR